MPLPLRNSAGDDGDTALHVAASALATALARVPAEARGEAAQDGLDLLAAIARLKPLCLVGRGGSDAFRGVLPAVARDAGLVALEAGPWAPLDGSGSLPDWYLAATAERRTRANLLYLCRDGGTRDAAAALSARGRVAPADEAALLGYPLCCVAQHHRQALGFEHLTIEMAARLAAGDIARMARMIAAGVAPLPASSDEWRRHDAFTAIAAARFTSVNMCTACAASATRPAAALSRRYAALAAVLGYPMEF